MSTAGVIIVYRDALFAEGLASLLRADGTVEVIGILAGEAVAFDQIRRLGPAVVILEGDPPEGEGQAFLERLLDTTPCVVEVGLNHEAVAVHQRAQIRHSRRFVNLVARLAKRDPARMNGRTRTGAPADRS